MMKAFLFIHGAWYGSWCWSRVNAALGPSVKLLTPDLPGRDALMPHAQISLKTHVDFIKELLAKFPQKVAIVAHSFGGVIATQLADEMPDKISEIIYVAAFLPKDGQSLIEIASSINHLERPPAMKMDSSGCTISLDLDNLEDLFFNCSSREDKKWAIERLCPEPFLPMAEKVSLKAGNVAGIAKTYIVCTKDNALTLEAQKAMSSCYPCNVLSLQTDHSPFLSTPNELAGILLNL